MTKPADSMEWLIEQNQSLLTRALEKLAAAERERDEARALIVTWATWLRVTFPKELEVGGEEQALLDYADDYSDRQQEVGQ